MTFFKGFFDYDALNAIRDENDPRCRADWCMNGIRSDGLMSLA